MAGTGTTTGTDPTAVQQAQQQMMQEQCEMQITQMQSTIASEREQQNFEQTTDAQKTGTDETNQLQSLSDQISSLISSREIHDIQRIGQ